MSAGSKTAVAGGTTVLVVAGFLVLGDTPEPEPAAAASSPCLAAPANSSGGNSIPSSAVAGYSGKQLDNAAAIIAAGKALGISRQGQTIGVMTAMGESSLRVLDRGDAVGPDSRGLFQQRANGAWGSYEDRMDPTTSATNFFKALQDVEGWQELSPTEAAHRTQRNADPYHYQKYWPAAVKVTNALAGMDPSASCGDSQPVKAQDDYPWPNKPTWKQVGVEAAANPHTGMLYRECVDFVIWRLNKQIGITKPPFKWTNQSLVNGNGNAISWRDQWQINGWDYGSKPKEGSVAWFAPGAAGAGNLGHVAMVSKVNKDDTVFLEEYNVAPNDHEYNTRTIDADAVSAYLYSPN